MIQPHYLALTAVLAVLGACPGAIQHRAEPHGGTLVPGALVSHSRGEAGGIVLLWPRVFPSELTGEMRPQATALQARLRAFIERELPGRPLDIRPEPERVCPANGCLGTSIGVLLVRVKDGCAAVLQVGRPGRSPARQEVWAGVMSIALQVPFREPPESYVTVSDFVPCDALLATSKEREASVIEAIRDAF